MLRMSKLTDYGTVVLTYMAGSGRQRHSAADVANHTRLAAPTVSKLLKVLTKAGLVKSYRGTNGGYALARPAARITAAQIIDALEGPVAITECSSLESHCEIESICQVSRAWQQINVAIRRALRDITLAQLAEPPSVTTLDLGLDTPGPEKPNLRI